MNFYEAIIRYAKPEFELPFAENSKYLFPKDKEENEKRFYQDAALEINDELGLKCGNDDAYNVLIWDMHAGEMKVIIAVDTDKKSIEDCTKYIEAYLCDNYSICDLVFADINEITTARFHQLGDKGDKNCYINHFRADECELCIDYRNNHSYKINEIVISDESITKNEILEQAKQIMADKSFYEEIERIYSDDNAKEYYGNPVHYKISACSKDSAMEIVKLLTRALKENNRLLGRRINSIYDISDCCYDDEDFAHMFELSHGNVVIFDMSGTEEEHGNYASTYEEAIRFFYELIKKHHVKTLCIFIENQSHPGFAGSMLGTVAEEIDIIEIKEGRGNIEQAIAFIEKLAKDNNYPVDLDEIKMRIADKKEIGAGEAYSIYNDWFKNGLRNNFYRAYKSCTCMKVCKGDKKSEPYDELQEMIGLSEVKKIVDEIIDSSKIQKLRSKMGLDSYKTSLHMVFTGNPGSAKTSVARLLANILAKEDVLTKGNFVECGRADLVGRYVGWTAKTVKSKFREADGGILFIDEAYSLVDESHSFGDEAINTIVQEIENYRDSVIVIFAGYPEKMKEFLDKNEGLRSRIAFHIDFPDYNAQELVDIFKLMASKKGYKYDDVIIEKCHKIFEAACKQKEFGNGRFVRNFLEQAMMSQASRISKKYRGKKVNKKALVTFKPEDFDVNISENAMKETARTIGFAV